MIPQSADQKASKTEFQTALQRAIHRGELPHTDNHFDQDTEAALYAVARQSPSPSTKLIKRAKECFAAQ